MKVVPGDHRYSERGSSLADLPRAFQSAAPALGWACQVRWKDSMFNAQQDKLIYYDTCTAEKC